MIVYSYDKTTGEYMGETTADKSPLEPGVWLYPANTTTVKPPAVGIKEAAVWDGKAWIVVEDHRGKKGYIGNEQVEITDLGPLPPGWSATPPPTEEDIQRTITDAIQQRLDVFAQIRNYDGILSAASYVTSTVPKFQTEGQYAVAARDQTWVAAYAILAAVEAGTRPIPTVEEVFAELPALEWPVRLNGF